MLVLASTCLTGDALSWLSNPSTQRTIHSYDDFIKKLTAQFSPVDADTASRDKLPHCTQTTTVEAYVTAFRDLIANITDLCPKEALHRFKEGLKEKVKLHVALSKPTSVGDAMATALSYERLTHPTPSHSHTQSASSSSNRPPARLNVTRTHESRPRKPITDEERADLAAKGGCFYCRQLGHVVVDCPLRPKNGRPQ